MLWWVGQNLVVTAILASVVWIVCKTTRIGPATRHALWMVVLLKLLMPPLVVWPWGVNELFATLDAKPSADAEAVVLTEPAESIQVDLSTFASPVTSADEVVLGNLIEIPIEPIEILVNPVETEVSEVSLIEAADRSDGTWTAWLSKASWPLWLVGTIFFALLHTIRIVRMAARLRRGNAPHREVIEQVAAMSRRLRIKPVQTRGVDGIGSPCIWAFLRPRLLWPSELSLRILPHALRGIIIHELAHVKRRDHWVGWLELIAGCVWWWNPLFWYVRHQLRENAELACDAWVVSTLPDGRRAYAEGLLAVCESVSRLSAPLPAVGATASGRQSIERRLSMILRGQSSFRLSRGGLLAALILAAMALPAWSQRSVAIEEKDRELGIFENVAKVDSAYSTDFVTNAQLDRSVKVITGNFVSSLPKDAQKILNEHRRLEEEAHREAEQRALQRRQELIRELCAFQERCTREGKLDEAVAVRNEIEKLQGQGPRLSIATADGVPILKEVPLVGPLFSNVLNDAVKETTINLLEDGDSSQSDIRYQVLRFHQQQGKPEPTVWAQAKWNFADFKKWLSDNPQATPREIGKKLNDMEAGFASVTVTTSVRLDQIEDEIVRVSAAKLEPGKVRYIFLPGQMVLIREAGKDQAQRDRNSAHATPTKPANPPALSYPIFPQAPPLTSNMTPEQQQLIAKFVGTQAPTLTPEQRQESRNWFRKEWAGKGFQFTPAIEWLLQHDFTDGAPLNGGLLSARWAPSTDAAVKEDAVQRDREIETAIQNVDVEKQKLTDMTAKWRESNSAAAVGIPGAGTLADFGLGETPIPEELKRQQLRVNLAEIELQRAVLRRQLWWPGLLAPATGNPKGSATN